MRWNDEWFRTAISEHKTILDTLNNLVHGNITEKRRRDAYRDLRRAIALHFMWEEETLYLRGRDLIKNEALLRVSAVQHGRINRLINQMDALDWGCDGWKRSLLDLEETILEHIRYEETEVIPVLRTAVAKARAHAAKAAKVAVA